MKKVLSFMLLFLIFIGKANALDLNISSQNAILYNLDTGEVLYEKQADEQKSIASLTKIMTALVTLESVDDLNQQVVLENEDFKGLAEANAVTAGFTKGEVVTYKDLLYGLLLPSGADAAKALARNISGSEQKFINKMNEKAKSLKLKNTHFSTVIGLDDDKNYSTAKEVSIIFKEALKNKDFRTIITTKNYTSTDGKITFKSTIDNNAKKFDIEVPYILGGKTGTTTNAGLCLATIAKENNVNYMLVTLGAPYDKKAPHHIEDAKIIYDYFIQNYGNHLIVNKNKSFKEIKVKYTKNNTLKLYPEKNITKYLNNNYNQNDIKYVYDGKKEISALEKKGSKLVSLKIYYKNKIIDTQIITLNQNLKFSLTSFIKDNIILVCILIIPLILIIKKIASH